MILEKYGALALGVNTLARQHVSTSITDVFLLAPGNKNEINSS